MAFNHSIGLILNGYIMAGIQYSDEMEYAPKLKAKKSWTREEVKLLISRAFSSDLINTQSASDLDDWIEKNV